ncbi:MAG: phospholipid-binding protein MlaC [Vibrio sp.]
MLKRYFILVLSLVLSWAVHSQEVVQTQPYTMMKQVAQQAFNRLKNEQPKIHQDPEYLKTIVEQELMPYVNAKYAALKLLGPNLRGAKRSDVEAFIKAFRAYLVTNYAQVLTQYTDQNIRFGPENDIANDRRITSVRVDIVDHSRPNIKLDFKLRKEKSGEWKVYDMVAEGISMLSSKRSEWSSKIRNEGILSVSKDLQRLADNKIHFESDSK